jgi:hypothetical protein
MAALNKRHEKKYYGLKKVNLAKVQRQLIKILPNLEQGGYNAFRCRRIINWIDIVLENPPMKDLKALRRYYLEFEEILKAEGEI